MNTRSATGRRRLIAIGGATALAALLVGAILLISQQAQAQASAPTLSTLTEADGLIHEMDQVSLFDETPAVTKLDPELLAAARAAATEADADGVRIQVNSGWRSPAHQEALLAEAVRTYGSADEAARWVATPENSAHVSGDAVDLGPEDAQDWLSVNGSRFGLCQIYENEPWHFELRPAAIANGCPFMYTDPTADPRTQR